jgi:hypothetical protein
METSGWISIIAILLSLIAVIVSILALWKNNFAAFKPMLSVGYCTFSIYPIKNENQRWFIPSFEIPINFTNSGLTLAR